MTPPDFFVIANYAEAALWIAIGLGFAIVALARPTARRRALLAAATLIAFGLSDIVETRTGAWWRPWWLFVWKAMCVAALLALAIDHFRRRHRGA